MRIRSLSALAAFAVLSVLVLAVSASGATGGEATQTYIVQMLDAPAVAYDGGVAGIPATKPGKGKKIDPEADNVKRYRGHLKNKHDKALGNVGGGAVVYDYGITFNGFAARLTEGQAEAMRLQKGVVAVTPDRLVSMDTSTTPAFLRLTAKDGLWDQLGGVSKGGLNKGAGEDIIIGIVDSGIWPDSKSFSDRKLDGSNGNLYPHKVTGFHGTCQAGESFTSSNCNRKLIGARYFNAAGRRRRARGCASVGVHVSARLQRTRHPHRLDGGWQFRRRHDRAGVRVRPDQRHGAARAHLRVQGAVVDGGRRDGERIPLRPRRGDRTGRR